CDSFGLVDPQAFHSLLAVELESGETAQSDITESITYEKRDQGQCYRLSGEMALPEGRYTLDHLAKDLAGNAAVPSPLSASFTIDRTPPVLTLLTADGVLTNNPLFEIRARVTDNLSPTTTRVFVN